MKFMFQILDKITKFFSLAIDIYLYSTGKKTIETPLNLQRLAVVAEYLQQLKDCTLHRIDPRYLEGEFSNFPISLQIIDLKDPSPDLISLTFTYKSFLKPFTLYNKRGYRRERNSERYSIVGLYGFSPYSEPALLGFFSKEIRKTFQNLKMPLHSITMTEKQFRVEIRNSSATGALVEKTLIELRNLAQLLEKRFDSAEALRKNMKEELHQDLRLRFLEAYLEETTLQDSSDPFIQSIMEEGSSDEKALILLKDKIFHPELLSSLYPELIPSLKRWVLNKFIRIENDLLFDHLYKHIDTQIQDAYFRKKIFTYLLFCRKEYHIRSIENLVAKNNPRSREFIHILGSIGDYKTINFLHKRKNTANSHNIDQAIAKIQDRIGTGDSGWMSIADHSGSDGALSTVEE
jgi:hypothetical protein